MPKLVAGRVKVHYTLIDSRKIGSKVTEAQGRHQLKIVVAIDLSFADNEAHTPLSQDTTYLQMHQDLARRYIQLYEAKIVQDFEPFAVAEFGSVLLAFDSIAQIRTVLFELEQKSQIRPQVRLIRPRFSCHLGEIPTGQPILESSVVRRAIAMIELAKSGEIVVSRTVYDMLPKQQADFAEFDQDTFVMGGSTNLQIVEGRWADNDQDQNLQQVPTPKDRIEQTRTKKILRDTADAVSEDGTIVGLPFTPNFEDSTVPEDATIVGPTVLPPKPPAKESLSSFKVIAAAEEAISSKNIKVCYRALADINALMQGNEHNADAALNACRANIEDALKFSGDAVYFIQNRPHFLRLDRAIELGRRAPKRIVDIHVGCRLVSKFGRQTRIEYKDNEFQVTDLGSTNGTFLNNTHVTTGNWKLIQNDAKIRTGGGLKPPKPGLCELACTRVSGEYSALVVEFQTSRMGPADLEKISPNWPTMHLDSEPRWVLAPSGILIGSSPECIIKVPTKEHTVAAQITFNNGYFIKPLGDTKLMILGTLFTQEVPLSEESEININGTNIRFSSQFLFYKNNPLNQINE